MKKEKRKFQNNLRKYRNQKGLTVQKLADDVHVSRQTIYQLAQNRYQPSLILAFDLANIFEVRIEEVFQLVE
ncbi:transcriptional regulator [Listeria monocytogenes]|uniref:Transcriptional regulator n=1 Tax=Listeria monocytogenes TaxID=1639 RepID=A0AAN2WJS4_LISMN|nr:transcriptional regulator [Listeria monocytogenes]EAC3367816.1 transcriptional regulator [Listeria monocytogenes]EAC7086917.1 transcriptional regulator [Listeria monocytogenes]EAC8542071.1 transcriptional regulator [Listeria monocytogenes]EAC8548073.1 transcriptional regulator [Listeria monocytogenes]